MASLTFTNLPLAEVAIRVVPVERVAFSLRGVVEIWSRLRREVDGEGFDEIEQLANSEPPPGRGPTLSISLGAEPVATRLRDKSLGLMLAIQPDLISLRWVAESGIDYPRFPRLMEVLERVTSNLRALAPSIHFDVANMSYVNLVEVGESPQGFLGKYFSPAVAPGLLSQDLALHALNLAWSDGRNDLRLAIDRGSAKRESDVFAYLVTTVAGRRFQPSIFPRDEVGQLHDRLQDLFSEVITDTARSEWGYIERT